MSDRRKFIKGFGLFGAVFAGAATAKVVIEEKKPEVEDISHLAPENPVTLTLQGQKIQKEEKVYHDVYGNRVFMMHSNPEFANKVHLSVGKDDRLWIKVGDDWKRVAVDQ